MMRQLGTMALGALIKGRRLNSVVTAPLTGTGSARFSLR